MGATEGRLQHLESVVDALGGVVWEFDLDTRTFVWVSAGCERLFGYRRGEWIDADFLANAVHPDDLDAVMSCRCGESGETSSTEFDYRLICADGSTRWVRDIISEQPCRCDGLLRGITIDVTAEKLAEAAVVRSDERHRRQAEEFDAIFELLRDLYFRLDPEGRIEHYRAPSEGILYAKPESFLGRRFDEVLPPGVSDVMRTAVDSCRLTGEMTVIEYELPSGGETREWEGRFLPLAEGHVALICRDITARKNQERRLREQRDFLDMILDTIDSGVVVVAGQDPPIVRAANRLAANLVGYELDELIGMPTSVFHRDSEEWHRFLETARGITSAGNAASCEIRMMRKDGSEFDAEVCVRGLGLPNADRVSVIRDISDRKAAERMMRESEMRFRSIVEEAPFGVHLYELRNEVPVLTAANEAADAILGITHAPLIDLELREAFPDVAAKGWEKVYRDIAMNGGSWHSEITHDRPGTQGTLEVTVFQTSPGRLAVAFTDVTERTAMDRADRAHKVRVSALAAEIAATADRERRGLAEELHDRVSQPLAVARMHLAAAVDDHGRFDRGELEAATHMLEDAIGQARMLTTELYPPVLRELGIGAALRWLTEEFEAKYGLQCTVTLTDVEFNVGEEGANALFRAARELLMNVVKHAETGRVWVSLDAFADVAVLTIADRGCGMPTEASGTSDGFGLFSVRERLAHLGGEMDVESGPGEGTRVTLTVPTTSS